MEVQSKVYHRVVEAIIQQSQPFQASMPPHWANACGGGVVQPSVGSAGYTTSSI
jgi:hypothetical protein